MARKSKTEQLENLFGLIPDKQIAVLAGVKQAASVQTQRQKKGIPSFKTNLNKIRRAIPSLNAKSNNADVAKELNVPVELLVALRVEKEIIADAKAATKKYDLHKEVVQALLDMQTHEKPGRKTKKTKTTSKKTVKAEKVKKAPAKKESAKKESAKKEEKKTTVKEKKTKKAPAKKESVKKEVAKKEKKETSKKESTQFLNAYECTFVHGDEMTLVYVTASSFQEASKKVEGIDSVKGALNSINLLGFALN